MLRSFVSLAWAEPTSQDPSCHYVARLAKEVSNEVSFAVCLEAGNLRRLLGNVGSESDRKALLEHILG